MSFLKFLLPCRPFAKTKHPNEFPFQVLGFLNMMTLNWMSNKIHSIYTHGYHINDLAWVCSEDDTASKNCEKIEQLRLKHASAPLTKIYIRFILPLLFTSILASFTSNLLEFAGSAIFIRLLMDYIKSDSGSKTYGLLLVFFVLVLSIVKCLMRTLSHYLSILSGGRLKSGMMYYMYKKLLGVRGLQGKTVGQMVNLFANDMQRIYEVTTNLPSVLVVPILFTASLLYSTAYLGMWCFIGFAILFLLFFVQYFLSRWNNHFRAQAIKATDKRIEMVSELLISIKVVKLYSWEDSFKERITYWRDQEKLYLKKAALLQSLSISLIPLISTISLVTMFAGFIASGNKLAVSDAFVIMSLYNLTKVRLSSLPYYIRLWSDSRVSLVRIQSLFKMEDIDTPITSITSNPENTIEVVNASFGWSRPSFFTADNIRPSVSTYSSESLDKYFSEAYNPHMNSLPQVFLSNASFNARISNTFFTATHNNHHKDQYNAQYENYYMNNYNNHPRDNQSDSHHNNRNKNNKLAEVSPESVQDSNLNFQNSVLSKSLMKKQTSTQTGSAIAAVEEYAKKNFLSDETYVEDVRKRQLCRKYLCCLLDINLNIEKGKMVAVCGRIGSGKSSLLSSLIGQTKLLTGSVRVKGSIAYVGQQAWIYNGSIRDNILFCKPFELRRYNEVIEQCCLTNDINRLLARDATSVGEGGISLSGGEKQRLVLARAIYSDADILLLDDPLSAVDSVMRKQLFEMCLMKACQKGRTVIFNTHHLEYVSKCDEIIFLKNGRIFEQGNHEEMMKSNGEYATNIKAFYPEKESKKIDETLSEELIPDETESILEQGYLFHENDEDNVGSTFLSRRAIKWSTYQTYLKALGGWKSLFKIFLLFLLPVIVIFVNDYWLSLYLLPDCDLQEENETNSSRLTVSIDLKEYSIVTNSPIGLKALIHTENPNTSNTITYNSTLFLKEKAFDSHFIGNTKKEVTEYRPLCGNMASVKIFLAVYIATALSTVIFLTARSFVFVKKTLKAASCMHDQMMEKILNAPVMYLISNPIGKVISSLTSGMDGIDIRLPLKLEDMFDNGCNLIISVVSVSIAFPVFLIFVFLLGIVIFFLQKVSRLVTRQLKRSESVNKSPIYCHVLSTVTGLATIQGYNKESDFLKKFSNLVDRHISSTLTLNLYSKWLSLRLELMSIMCAVLVSFFIVVSKGSIQPSFAGLAIAYIVQLNSLLQHTVKLTSEIEARFNSVEKIANLIQTMPIEDKEHTTREPLPKDWPSQGKIVFKNFSLRYAENLPLVLNNISFKIKPEEKIGVVGRTGSGKSSLIASLFRLLEKSSGNIYIDDIDISEISIKDLRSRLGIIPQDPVLFTGTVRYNLDPLKNYSDDEIWDALEKCRMKDTIMRFKYGLSSKISEGGSNFSMGEKQLLCLARSFVKKTKILILDEATAAVDLEMDQVIQSTISDILMGRTIITIAHRFKTVLQCDRVLSLENGKVGEFDAPRNLLRNKNSFLNLAKNAEDKISSIDNLD